MELIALILGFFGASSIALNEGKKEGYKRGYEDGYRDAQMGVRRVE